MIAAPSTPNFFPFIPDFFPAVIPAFLPPVIPAKAGIQRGADAVGCSGWERGRPARIAFVRIRIFRIIGFSGFYRLVFDRQAPIRIRLGGIYGYGENRNMGESKS